jgi:hypothetical protein
LLPTRPSQVGVPSVNAPTVEPTVAVPMAIVAETYIPTEMTVRADLTRLMPEPA